MDNNSIVLSCVYMYDRFRLLKVTNYYALYYGAVGFLTSVLSRGERGSFGY